MEAKSYQIELYQLAQKKNVVIKLNTGSGKTFIASMLIKDYLNHNKKKIFFLVKNASLAQQHFLYLKEYLFLKNEIGFFHGNMNNSWVDFWSKDKWSTEFEKHKIIIMTARVFLDILNHKKYSLDDVCLLIFDEVHHLAKADDYSQISEHLTGNRLDIKVLGLTACLVKTVKRISDIDFLIEEMERRLNCRIVTSLDSIANEFSRNIKNVFVDFKEVKTDNIESLQNILDHYFSKIQNIDILKLNESTLSNHPTPFAEENPFVCLKKYFNEISSVLKKLGVIPCKSIVDMFISDLPTLEQGVQFLDENYRFAFQIFSKCLLKMQKTVNEILTNSKKLNCSNKVIKLIKYLKTLNSTTSSDQKEFFILIFVAERIQALALHELLNLLPQINDGFSFLKTEFIIGHTTATYPKKMEMNAKEQHDIITRFREKKFNILIATNVVEEGLDIPHCNVVIKFDPPCEFRSYVQSKGRARANFSQYIIFDKEENMIQIKDKIDFFDKVNKLINKSLKTRAIENEFSDEDSNDCFPDDDINTTDYMPKGRTGPRITLNSASGVLNRYIGKLRCNSLSDIKIIYSIEKSESNLFETTLWLPMPSPYLDEIKGGFHSNKRKSKQFANLKACILLHELDELDDNLLPFNRYEDDDEDEKTKVSKPSDINLYPIYVTNKLCTDYQHLAVTTDTLYLYSIRYSPQVFLKLGIENLSGFDMSSSIGILLSKPIHEEMYLAKFPIYLVGGSCTASIQFESKISVSPRHLDILLKCHKALFEIYAQRMRKFDQNISYMPNESKCSMVVTVLKDYKINFDTIETIISKPFVVKLTDKPQSTWSGSVIRPMYLKKEFGAHVVTKVCEDMNANSNLKNCDIDFRTHFNKQYNITISDEEAELPLVSGVRLTTIQNCTNKEKRSLKESKRLQRINKSDIYFIPCLTECISLSSSLWTQLCIFPTIHLRLNQILTLQEFVEKVDFMELKHTSDVMEINFDTCYNIENLTKSDMYLDEVSFVNNVFPCFVAKKCNDRLDLEQYEILGDSFLKFITTKYLYHFSKSNDMEGKLTQKRSKLISNRRLFQLAQEKELSKYFFTINLDPKVNYMPPHFVSTVDNNKKNMREFVSYKSKCLADCVESLIGAILTNYGIDYGVKFLLWMDMDLLPPDHSHEIEVHAQPFVSPFRNFDSTYIPENIKELESILQYTFKHKAYAVQAITHPTSLENRQFSCYQRLEFLGDAVLDFLVTSHIMVHNNRMRPGTITNLRSALVSNSTFAFLSAKWEFHKFLSFFDNKMFVALPQVVKSILENNLDTSTLFLKKSEQHKVIVKVLGDIFESIAGAVFVDSDYDIDVVWTIFKRLMEQPLKKFSNRVPKNQITLLYEKFPGLKCNFEVEEITNLTKLTATLPNGTCYEIKESNKMLCKISLAAKLLSVDDAGDVDLTDECLMEH